MYTSVFGQHDPEKSLMERTSKRDRYIYIYGDLKANATTSKYASNLIQSNLLLELAMESLKTCAC
jgi:hypothetical protein